MKATMVKLLHQTDFRSILRLQSLPTEHFQSHQIRPVEQELQTHLKRKKI